MNEIPSSQKLNPSECTHTACTLDLADDFEIASVRQTFYYKFHVRIRCLTCDTCWPMTFIRTGMPMWPTLEDIYK